VRVETAGGGASEPDASLSALDRASAETLRREVEGARREPAEAGEETGPEVLRRLSTRELLVAGATSGQIGIALSLLAVGSQVFDNLLSKVSSGGSSRRWRRTWLMVVLVVVPAAAWRPGC
jgi:putative membrane protein